MSESNLRTQDEVLQMMYWMHGEHIGSEVTLAQFSQFLKVASDELIAALQRLQDGQLVRIHQAASQSTYSLTPLGMLEGARRFNDEFAAYLGQESHIECSDPNCDCHSDDFDGTCRHVQQHV